MRFFVVILVAIVVLFDIAQAQWGFGGMPMGGMGMGGMGMMGGPYGGMGGGPYGGMGGGGWGRRRMMGGMMNPYMGMMYG
ncbi:CaeNaCin (Caenorhabditis bacteriocin) [Caenorhabditis elegans]|uniref:CaeNaCin (Caenorhabditis bacteriocin) n=1 Tax=Caenorhabditis elegans TaxID=6239 RepID=Q0KHC3_CAEEL|nr:CaeNaCin (Caenorhabditis bacteriocin) [Caenorhabditis elegans]CAL36503.1 CaeNaCin (Caenorhabditis bacteriocin) [Caenorhabditis elegans]|eukprot:NP_001076731.1 Uncharacterized protein CELE_Y43C5A.7 [Caenorhabditis elegans]